MLEKIDPHKTQGPGELPAKVLKECAAEIAPALSKIFESTYESGDVPEEWRKANISPSIKGRTPARLMLLITGQCL